jgi:hypothetical protein
MLRRAAGREDVLCQARTLLPEAEQQGILSSRPTGGMPAKDSRFIIPRSGVAKRIVLDLSAPGRTSTAPTP